VASNQISNILIFNDISNTTQAPLVHFIVHLVSSSHLKASTAEEATGIYSLADGRDAERALAV